MSENFLREIGMPRDDEAYQQGAPEFGSRNAVIRRLTVPLSAAQSDVKYEFSGSWLWAATTVGLNANCDIKFNEQIGQPINFRKGQVLAGYPFQRIFVSNIAQAGASITFHTSQQMIDIRNAITDVTQFQEAPFDLFATGQVVVGAALTLIALANPLRKRLVIKALNANTAPVYITNILGGLASGFELGPGQEVETRQINLDIYGIRGGVAQTVCYLEEMNVA